MTSLARVEGEAKSLVVKKALPLSVGDRRDHRQLVVLHLQGKAVFLDDLLVAPAIGAVEFGDQRRLFLDADLVDAILEAVQGEDAAIAEIPRVLHGVHDEVGGEGFEGMVGFRHCGLSVGV